MGGDEIVPHLASLLHFAHFQPSHRTRFELSPDFVSKFWVLSADGKPVGSAKHNLLHNQLDYHNFGLGSRK